ncbi:MAG: hypothetical protein K2Z80_30400 [Xanthobacteraceae bacterium]|nr:hypothetical protein [Xanthobacteraceae bacterium]
MYDPLSRTAQEIAKIKTTSQPPTSVMAAAAIADLWDIVWVSKDGRTGVQLSVGGDVAHSSDWLVAIDHEFHWVRTMDRIWLLGWPNDAQPPIVQVALRPNRQSAYEHAIDRTGMHTLPGLLRTAARRTTTALMPQVVAAVARTQGRVEVADAWDLLAVDGTDQRQLAVGAVNLGMAIGRMIPRDRDGEVMATLDAWNRLFKAPPNNPDPFAAAQAGRVPSIYNDVFVRILGDDQDDGGTVH